MILDYCRENKVAIHFFCKDELDAICKLFSDGQYIETTNYVEGFVSFTRIKEGKDITSNYRCSGPAFSNWYKDYTILTTAEFLELADEQVSFLELLDKPIE